MITQARRRAFISRASVATLAIATPVWLGAQFYFQMWEGSELGRPSDWAPRVAIALCLVIVPGSMLLALTALVWLSSTRTRR